MEAEFYTMNNDTANFLEKLGVPPPQFTTGYSYERRLASMNIAFVYHIYLIVFRTFTLPKIPIKMRI